MRNPEQQPAKNPGNVHVIQPSRAKERPVMEHLDTALSLLSPVILLLLWEAGARTGLINTRFFSSPISVMKAFYVLLVDGSLMNDLGISLVRVFVGFLIGAAPGVIIGVMMGLSPVMRALLNPLIAALHPIPKTAIMPLIMLIFGLGEPSKYAIIATGVFFVVVINTMLGVLSIPNIYLEVGKNLGLSRWQMFRRIALPGAMPHIASGCQLGFGLALVLLVVAEMMAAKSGIGYLIWTAWQMFDIDQMFVGLIVVAMLGFFSQVGLDYLQKKLVPWYGVGR